MVLLLLRGYQLGLVFPNNFPSVTKTKETKEKVFYALRILCYCLGVQEQFNLFSWPIEDIEHIAKYDFWTNMYPVIVNRDNLLKIKTHSMNLELFDKTFCKFVYYLWKKEVYYMANITQTDKSVLGKKKKLTGYLFIKNRLILKSPNTLALFIINQSIKHKRFIMNTYKRLNL